MFRHSKIFAAVLIFAFSASLAFAAGAQDDGAMEAEEGVPIYGGTLTWSYWVVYSYDMTGWDPMYDWSAMVATEPYIETLMTGDINRGPRGTNEYPFLKLEVTPEEYVTGELAESWEVTADRIIFRLKPGIYLTGKSVNPGVGERREFTAEDIKYNADLALVNEYTGWVVDWVDNVEVVDKYTVAFNLSRFKSTWSLHLGYGYGGLEHPVVREVREAGVNDWKNHYGTGPFLLTDYTEGSSITYEKNEDYWGKEVINGKEYQLPFVDKIICPIILDMSTKIAALRTGKLDLANRVPLTYDETLMSTSPKLISRSYPAGSTYFTGYQHQDGTVPVEPFTDIRVRKALSAAIDRETLVEDLYIDGEVLSWPVNTTVDGVFVPIDELPKNIKEFFVYNPDYAMELLDEAGYPNGFSTELWIRAGTAVEEDMYSLVVGYWDAIGVDAKLKVLEPGTHAAISGTKEFPQMFAGGSASGDPLYMENWFNAPGNYNLANFNDPEMTAKFRNAQTIVDPNESRPIFKELSLELLERGIYLTLPSPKYNIYWWPWLKNYHGEVDCSYFGTGTIGARVWLDKNLKKEMGF